MGSNMAPTNDQWRQHGKNTASNNVGTLFSRNHNNDCAAGTWLLLKDHLCDGDWLVFCFFPSLTTLPLSLPPSLPSSELLLLLASSLPLLPRRPSCDFWLQSPLVAQASDLAAGPAVPGSSFCSLSRSSTTAPVVNMAFASSSSESRRLFLELSISTAVSFLFPEVVQEVLPILLTHLLVSKKRLH